MRMLHLIALSLILFASTTASDPLVDYYVNLIQENQYQAFYNYTFRVDNSDFNGPNTNIFPQYAGTYDFVIVGGGSAGAVLANRLSEIRHWRILVIEAGGDETQFTDIPGQFGPVWLSDFNWGYFTTPQTQSCLGMKDQRCLFPRGKVLGGSSTIDTMMYVRGNRRDFDQWEKLGNRGWSYSNVLPYFIKSENSEINGDFGYHGRGGLWNVQYSTPNGPALQNFFDGSQELGLKKIDYNGREQIGVSRMQFNTRRGRRDSTGRAFLDPARYRPNLTVITKSLATKILFDYYNTAIGVVFRKNGTDYVVLANKEVLLSAGSINSPQLLMLSGIGPRQHLLNKKIPVIQDLPVGQNLKDHIMFFGLSFRTNLTIEIPTLEEQVEEYLAGTGPLTKPADVSGVSFSSRLVTGSGAPKMEYVFLPNDPTGPALGLLFNVRDEIVINYSLQTNQATDFKILLKYLHPKSTGQVTLQSNNPVDFPLIDTAFYTDRYNEDIETVYQGVLEVLTLINTRAFRRINATLVEYPFCSGFDTLSRDYWYCFIKDLSATSYHPIKTTRMGPDRRTSVVDDKLRVHGVRNLRVIDAGVIPETTSGHVDSTTVMIAEKASDLIKRQYGQL